MKRIIASVFLAMTALITGCSADKLNAASDNLSPVTGINSSVKNSSENDESEFGHTQSSDSGTNVSEGVSEIIQSAENNSDPTEGNETNKILVVYFSCTNTTKSLAEYAADILGADIYEIVPAVPYTEADLAYYTDGRADREQADPAARPAISGSVSNMSDYDTIILGYPIWHGQAPRIISTFLESYDFSGKTIVPFCTSHSSGMGSSADNLHSLCSAEWKDGKRFGGGDSRNEVETWLNNL